MNTQEALEHSARIVIQDVLNLHAGEQFLIITNPSGDVETISRALYNQALAMGVETTLIIQPEKTQLDFANRAALAAFHANVDAFASISANKLGKDALGIAKPWIMSDGQKIDHIFHYYLDGLKTQRAIWTPGITVDMFIRTAPIDYDLLLKRCRAISAALEGAESVHVTAPGGTDIIVPIAGRKPMSDDGIFIKGGDGGNVPAGEVFISPANGQSRGVIVFDGSISLNSGDMITETPVRVTVENGFVTSVTGGREAELLEQSLKAGEEQARRFAAEGKLSAADGETYARNARNLGELGIGLNPAAEIRGNMLEDEKAFSTCHFAIGSNYDNDAEAMIHLDCLVRNPTIIINRPDGSSVCVEKDGTLEPAFENP